MTLNSTLARILTSNVLSWKDFIGHCEAKCIAISLISRLNAISMCYNLSWTLTMLHFIEAYRWLHVMLALLTNLKSVPDCFLLRNYQLNGSMMLEIQLGSASLAVYSRKDIWPIGVSKSSRSNLDCLPSHLHMSWSTMREKL